MSASLNAVPTSNYASVDASSNFNSGSANNLRSKGSPDTFSQVLRRTSDEQRSSGTNSNRQSDKKEKKSEKKDSGADTATVPTPDSNPVSGKSSLPITFLFGLPIEQLPGFDAQHDNNSTVSAIDAKELSANRLTQVGSGPQTRDTAGDFGLLTMQASLLPTPDISETADTGAADSKSPGLMGIGENGNSMKGATGAPLGANTLAFALRLGSGVQAASAEEVNNPSQTVQGSVLPAPDTSETSDTGGADIKSPDVIAIGENGNSMKGTAGTPATPNTVPLAQRLGSGVQAASAEKVNNTSKTEPPAAGESVQTNLAAATHSAVEAASGSALEEHTHEHGESDQQGQNMVDLSATRTAAPFDTAKVAEENTAPSSAQVPTDPSSASTNEPVKNVHMQLVSEDNRRVDVRLIDRGGELHVSVKSADPALTQNLQDHLPDLTARLDKQHMQTEVWVPKAAEPTKAQSGNANGSPADSNNRSYSRNSEGKKDGQQQRKPDWVDALENYS